jgi:nitrite reductase/ring-hydroxylating ferredoxin subunit
VYNAQQFVSKAAAASPQEFPKLPDIPRRRYLDDRFYQAEQEYVFRRSWLIAGHVSELPGPGSYRVLDLPFAPVLLVRGEDGRVRAMLNSCRHRGAPVVRDNEGCARRLSCQYHGWSYDLCGKLVGVPERHDFRDLDLDQHPLQALRCECWGGLVFINFDLDAPPLLEWLGPIAERYGHLVEAPLRVVSKKSYLLNCNWKIVVDAFIETYHVNTIHRQTAAQVIVPSKTDLLLHPGGHGTMVTPYREDLLKISEWKGTALRTSLPSIPDFEFVGAVITAGLFPNVIMPFEAPGFPIHVKWPLSIDRTRMDLVWYGLDWGDRAMPEEWNARVAAYDMLVQEDLVNMEFMQKSLEADPKKGIPLCKQERRLWHFHAAIDRCIGTDRIDPELRVPDLLQDYVEG